MLRHPALAVALFLSASCELAGAPPAQTTKPVAPSPGPAPGMSARIVPAAAAEPMADFRPMSRLGPSWGKEKPRFKVKPAVEEEKPAAEEEKPAPAAPAPPASTP